MADDELNREQQTENPEKSRPGPEAETFAELFAVNSTDEAVAEIVAGGKQRLERMLAQARDLGFDDDEREQIFQILHDIELRLSEQAAVYEEKRTQLLQEVIDRGGSLGRVNELGEQVYHLNQSAKRVRDTAQYVEILPEGGVEVDIDAILDKLKHLENKQAMYKPIMREIFSNPEEVHSETWRTVWRKTEQRLRAETHVLDSYDEEKVDLFGEDLTRQSGLNDTSGKVRIKFIGDVTSISPEDRARVIKAKKLEDIPDIIAQYRLDCVTADDLSFLRQAATGHMKGGYDQVYRKVHIADRQPTLEERIQFFIRAGRLTEPVKSLVHELLHHRQALAGLSEGMVNVLGEAQSHYTHPLSGETQGIVGTIQTLTNPKGGYRFSMEMSVEAASAIEKLNALKLSQSEISTIIAQCDWDENLNRYPDIDRQIFKVMKEREIDEEDLALLQDELRLQRKADILEAQIIAQEELCHALGYKKVEEIMARSKPSLEVGFSGSAGMPGQNRLIVHDAASLPSHIHERQSFVLTPTGGPSGYTVGRLIRRYTDDGTLHETEDQLADEDCRVLEEKLLASLARISVDELYDAGGIILNSDEDGEEAMNRFYAAFGSLAKKMGE